MQAETPKKVPEIGGELEVGIRQVQKYVAKQVNAPHVEERKGEKFEMPIELGVALGFLVDGKNAPFYVDPQEDQTGDVPEMNGNANFLPDSDVEDEDGEADSEIKANNAPQMLDDSEEEEIEISVEEEPVVEVQPEKPKKKRVVKKKNP